MGGGQGEGGYKQTKECSRHIRCFNILSEGMKDKIRQNFIQFSLG